jgi:SAM-dependent methyltransferase
MNPLEFANIAKVEEQFWWFQGMRRILFRLLDPLVRGRQIDRALEAGCGTGHFAQLLNGRYGWRVVASDREWEGLRYGRNLGVNGLLQADVTALPFQDDAFDVVLSLDVIVHFPRGQEEAPVRELSRVLAPGGMLVLRVAALDILRSRHSQFTSERQRFTRRRLIRLVKRHGIRVVRCTYANSLLLPIALAKFRVWEPLLRKPPESGLQPPRRWLNRVLYLPLFLESAWLGAGMNLPVGQSLILIGEKRPQGVGGSGSK